MVLLTNTAIKECAWSFSDIRSNAFQEQPHFFVFFESVPSGAANAKSFQTVVFLVRSDILGHTISDQD